MQFEIVAASVVMLILDNNTVERKNGMLLLINGRNIWIL